MVARKRKEQEPERIEPERGDLCAMLSAALKDAGVTKAAAARACSKTKQYVGYVCNGKADPKVGTLSAILAAAGYDLALVPKGCELPVECKVVPTALPEQSAVLDLSSLTETERRQRERGMQPWMEKHDGTRCPECGAAMWVRPGLVDRSTCMLNCPKCKHQEGRTAPFATQASFNRSAAYVKYFNGDFGVTRNLPR